MTEEWVGEVCEASGGRVTGENVEVLRRGRVGRFQGRRTERGRKTGLEACRQRQCEVGCWPAQESKREFRIDAGPCRIDKQEAETAQSLVFSIKPNRPGQAIAYVLSILDDREEKNRTGWFGDKCERAGHI